MFVMIQLHFVSNWPDAAGEAEAWPEGGGGMESGGRLTSRTKSEIQFGNQPKIRENWDEIGENREKTGCPCGRV